MKKYILKNNLTVIEHQKKSDSVTVQISIKTGSNCERQGTRGISHFIEHMLFEGTEKRKDAREISNEIESLGGEINAYTNNVRTGFYVKVPKKYFDKAVEIISDIIINPLFRQEDIDKERKIILKEINIFNDESRFYQWILFLKALFEKHPSGYPPYGTRKDVRRITKRDLLDYFNKYYTASNSVVSVVGDIKDCKSVMEKYFRDFKTGSQIIIKHSTEPLSKRPKIIKKKRKLMNSYMVFGYKTEPRLNKDSYVLDVIQAILGRGQSGRIFDEIRSKRGLAYEVGVHHEASTDFGYFAVYLAVDKKNIPLVKKLILEEFAKLSNLTQQEIKEAIGYIEGRYILDNEDTHNKADQLGYWEQIKDAELEKEYLNRIRKVTKRDILRVVGKYLTKNYTMAVVEQE